MEENATLSADYESNIEKCSIGDLDAFQMCEVLSFKDWENKENQKK